MTDWNILAEAIESSGQEGVSLDRLHELIMELSELWTLDLGSFLSPTNSLDERTRVLEQDNQRLADSLNFLMDHLPSGKAHEVRTLAIFLCIF